MHVTVEIADKKSKAEYFSVNVHHKWSASHFNNPSECDKLQICVI